MQEGRIYECFLGPQFDRPASYVSSGSNEFHDAGIVAGPFMGPPQHLRTMVAGWRATCKCRHPLGEVPVDLIDKRLAARIEPGIKSHRRLEIFVDCADPRH